MLDRKPAPMLITHREVARLCGISTKCLRAWVERGQWPRPHSIVEQTWFYRLADISHYIDQGEWPETVSYRPGLGRGRAAAGAE